MGRAVCKEARRNLLWEGMDIFLNLDGGRDTGVYKMVKSSSSCIHLHVNHNKVDLEQWHVSWIGGNRIRVLKGSCVVQKEGIYTTPIPQPHRPLRPDGKRRTPNRKGESMQLLSQVPRSPGMIPYGLAASWAGAVSAHRRARSQVPACARAALPHHS